MKPLMAALTKSQIYKERIQCVIAVGKIVRGGVFATIYPYMFKTLCESVSRLPSDENELADKLKMEVKMVVSQ
jgi:hypothetical protein